MTNELVLPPRGHHRRSAVAKGPEQRRRALLVPPGLPNRPAISRYRR